MPTNGNLILVDPHHAMVGPTPNPLGHFENYKGVWRGGIDGYARPIGAVFYSQLDEGWQC